MPLRSGVRLTTIPPSNVRDQSALMARTLTDPECSGQQLTVEPWRVTVSERLELIDCDGLCHSCWRRPHPAGASECDPCSRRWIAPAPWHRSHAS